SPITVRSNTDFPLPEPPTTPSTSPRLTSRSSLSWSTRPPTRVVRPRTRTTGRSDAEARIEDGEGGIDNDHQKDRTNHGKRGEATDALGTARHLEARLAADEGDGGSEERRLQDADPEGPFADRE